MADDKEKLIEQFCAISGVTAERSKFYLESAAWNLETALGSLYEEDNDPEQLDSKKETTRKGADMPKLNILDSDSSDDEGQAFYAGGSEHSGQQVLGPPKKKKDVVSMLFKSAKDHGGEPIDPKQKMAPIKKNFKGTGYRLGETENDHEVIADSSKAENQPQTVVLRMWSTGFTVDDGPLREYTDPANHEFLNSIKRGQVPLELVRSARGGEVYMNMEDHRHDDYVAPPKAAFSGTGHTLGSPAPSVVGQVSDTGLPGGSSGRRTAVVSSAPSPGDLQELEQKAKCQLKLDPDAPTTSVQLRLPDGSRLVLKLNHNHTVGDIRSYLSTARPQLSNSFAIMTTFPHAQLTDNSKTLTEANLLNSALVVK